MTKIATNFSNAVSATSITRHSSAQQASSTTRTEAHAISRRTSNAVSTTMRLSQIWAPPDRRRQATKFNSHNNNKWQQQTITTWTITTTTNSNKRPQQTTTTTTNSNNNNRAITSRTTISRTWTNTAIINNSHRQYNHRIRSQTYQAVLRATITTTTTHTGNQLSSRATNTTITRRRRVITINQLKLKPNKIAVAELALTPTTTIRRHNRLVITTAVRNRITHTGIITTSNRAALLHRRLFRITRQLPAHMEMRLIVRRITARRRERVSMRRPHRRRMKRPLLIIQQLRKRQHWMLMKL